MSKLTLIRAFALAGGLALGFAGPALADVDDDEFRTGGCSGCFNAQVSAALNNFATIDTVYRGCGNGGGFGNLDNCDGGLGAGTGGDLLDFLIVIGDLRNSNTDPNGFGVPGGQSDVLYRLSANGSSRGIRCANDADPQPIGFLATEGFDGLSGTFDDASGGGANAGGGAANGTASDIAAPLAACNTSVGDPGDEFPLPAGTVKSGSFSEGCVVQASFLDADGQIDNDRTGVVPTGVSCDSAGDADCVQVGDTVDSETFNLSLQCDTGFADLPTSDFIDPGLNSQSFADADVFGAQIFKLAASNDVHAIGDANQKISLNDPQIELLFGTAGSGSICNWADVGATSDSGDDVNICFRAAGSGTRETFRNTWLANVGGDKTEVTGTDTGTSTNCLQFLENGGSETSTKTAYENGGNGDVITCLETIDGSIGYIDAADVSSEFYEVPIEGVDPASNDLIELVKCGHYRWWGPLSGGRPNNPALSDRGNVTPTSHETAHRAALRSPAAFPGNPSYLPLDGAAVTKNVTDGAYTLQFRPENCPAQPNAIDDI